MSFIINIFVLVLILIVRCGEDEVFMELYWKIIEKFRINTVAVYNSPNCLPLLNFKNPLQDANIKKSYMYFYKLIPIDSNENFQNYANYTELLLSMLKSNQSQQTANFSYYLDENEDINFIKKYNGSNEVLFDQLDRRIKIRCFLNFDSIHSDLFEYCYRDLYFVMFGLDQTTNIYTKVANFIIENSILDDNFSSYQVKINMPNNLTFKYQGIMDLVDSTLSK